MKLLTLMLLFLFVSCDLDELEEIPGGDVTRGFEFIESDKNLNPQERSYLLEFCDALERKRTDLVFDKRVKTIERYCDGRVVDSEEKSVRYDRVQFTERTSGRSLNYVFSKMLMVSNHVSIEKLCSQKNQPTIERYFDRSPTTAIQARLSGDTSRCYYGSTRRGSNLNGICLQVTSASASTPSSGNYDKVTSAESIILFKRVDKSFPVTGMPKYRLLIDRVCTPGSRQKFATEEIYLGP